MPKIQESKLKLDPKERGQGATIHSIQMLRAIAAALVAIFHGHQAFAGRVARPWFPQEEYFFAFGAVGVHIFFVISGFIMIVTSFGRDSFDARAFFRRRFARIYPIYWLCAITYLAVHQAIGRPYHLSWDGVLGALTLWPGLAASIVGPAWTLSFEMYFYICFGVAMMLGLTRGLMALGAIFGVAIILGAILHPTDGIAFVMTNSLLLEFLAGTAIGFLTLRGRLPKRSGPALTGLALGLFLAGIAIGYGRVPSALSWGVPSAILVFGLVTWERNSGSARTVRLAGRLGDSSYVLYLIHTLLVTLAVELALAHAGTTNLAPITAAALIGVVAVAISHLIHLAIERPLMARLNPKRASASVPPLVVQEAV